MAPRRVQVLFFPTRTELKEPWEGDVIKAVGPQHDPRIFDYDAPMAPQFEGVELIIDFSGRLVSREMADAASSAKLWHLLLTGFDHFDLNYWRTKHIPVANCPGALTCRAMAEGGIMLMLMLSRPWHESQLSFARRDFYKPLGFELENRVLLQVGFGGTARPLASKARAFAVRVGAIRLNLMFGHVRLSEQLGPHR